MATFKYSLVIFVICASCQGQFEVEDKSRAVRNDFRQDQWRAVENVQMDTSGWIPDRFPLEETNIDFQPPKRRRLRKRKRRPQIFSLTDSEIEILGDQLPPRRIRRPQLLDETREPWREMEEESRVRPNKRRRIGPTYPEVQILNEGHLSASIQFGQKDVRTTAKPTQHISMAQDDSSDEPPSNSTATPDLKTLLKQTGGLLSLSEILQQKNLSLSDLLSGRKQAISALTERPDDDVITEYKNPVESDVPAKGKYSSNYRRVASSQESASPAQYGFRKNEMATRRIALINGKENSLFTDAVKYDIFEEKSTEKMSASSNSVEYVSPNVITIDIRTTKTPKVTQGTSSETPALHKETFTTTEAGPTEKPNEISSTKANEIKDIYIQETHTSTRSSVVDSSSEQNAKIKQRKHNLPITSAKLKKKINPATLNSVMVTTIPPKAYTISISDLFGFAKLLNVSEPKEKDDGPLRMSFDLDGLIEETTKAFSAAPKTNAETTTQAHPETTTRPSTTTARPSTATKIIPEKLKPITAKDEIMEILKDQIAKDNLSKILASRNMTIEELIEQRERGSSQRHLADIFHNKTKEPEPKEEPHVGQIKNEIPFRPFAYFDRKPKSRPMPLELKKDSTGDRYVASVESVEESNESKAVEENKDKDMYTVTSFPMYKIEMDKKFKDDKPFPVPVWRGMYPSVYSGVYENNYKKGTVETLNNVDLQDSDAQRDEIIENTIADAINEKLNVEVNKNLYEEDDESFIKLPSGVKSAIFASLLIIGISLLLFITILMIFKWSQKQKKRLCYVNSLSCSKMKSPILEGPEKRTFRSFMTETLGRKKHHYKQHLQSMSDSIWDNDRKSSFQ